MREIVLVGVPIDSLGTPGGTELAPGVLREQGIAEGLGARDAGDLPVRIVGEERDPASGIVGYPTAVTTCEGVRDGVAPLLASGAFTVVLGGCCSLVPGVAADMPVAICAGLGDRELTGLGPAVPLIDLAHIALLAHRDSEEARVEGSVMPDALGIGTSVDCAAVQAAGPGAVGERIAEQLAAAAGRFWLSIDVDVLSGEAMPATPVQQDGGLSMDELAELAGPLARHPACAGLNLLWYDVDMDDARHTSGRALVDLLARLLPAS